MSTSEMFRFWLIKEMMPLLILLGIAVVMIVVVIVSSCIKGAARKLRHNKKGNNEK